MRSRFMAHVERLKKYIEESGREFYDVVEIAAALKVSVNYAREIAKTYAYIYGGMYNSGVLVVKREEKSGEQASEASEAVEG